MKNILLSTLAAFIISITSFAQTWEKDLEPFNKIITSPYVELVLEEGANEHIKIESWGVDEDEVQVKVKGNTLKIFVEGSRYIPREKKYKKMFKRKWRKRFHKKARKIKAHVTYRKLKKLQTRGDEDISINSVIKSDKFKLKVYGDSEVNVAGLDVGKLKVGLFGENNLRIEEGKSEKQVFRSFGSNYVDARSVESQITKARSFGNSELKVRSEDLVKVNSFGVIDLKYAGSADLNKGLVIGESKIRRRR